MPVRFARPNRPRSRRRPRPRKRSWSQRLEGSRFIVWQLFQMAAGGSRELPIALQLRRLCSEPMETMDKTWRWVIRGSRLFSSSFVISSPGPNVARSSDTPQSGSPPYSIRRPGRSMLETCARNGHIGAKAWPRTFTKKRSNRRRARLTFRYGLRCSRNFKDRLGSKSGWN